MVTKNKVAWYEGMFLQPQHFQQHDRYYEHLIEQHHKIIEQDNWGFTQLELNLDNLTIGKVGINRAEGLFPDGTYFSVPTIDDCPTLYSLPEGHTNITLYLALPLRSTSTAEYGGQEVKQAYRYHLVTKSIQDATADVHESSEIEVGSLSLKILSSEDDLTHYSVIPFARIKEVGANHKVIFDKAFLPSWLDALQEKHLTQFVQEVHSLLNSRGEMLSSRLTDTQQAGTAEIFDFILLQLTNKYECLFHFLCHQRALHPKKLFEHLLALMGEMATYTNNKRRPIEPPKYDQNNLFETFQPLIQETRRALSMVLEQNATKVALEERGHGLWVGQIPDRNLLHQEKTLFVMTVYADIPADRLRADLPALTKIAPVEHIKTIVARSLPGIPVEPLSQVPRQIPYHANFIYFGLNKQHELWPMLDKSGGIAIHTTGNIPGLKLELWAIKGNS